MSAGSPADDDRLSTAEGATEAVRPGHVPAGRTGAEAAERLGRQGPNTVRAERPRLVRQMVAKLSGPVPLLLEAAVVLELAAGRATEAVTAAVPVVFNAVRRFLEEGRAREALTLLRSRLAVRARVLRDGHWQLVNAVGIVPGDAVHVRLGDIVPADLAVFTGEVSVDQPALTGESADVDVHPGGRL